MESPFLHFFPGFADDVNEILKNLTTGYEQLQAQNNRLFLENARLQGVLVQAVSAIIMQNARPSVGLMGASICARAQASVDHSSSNEELCKDDEEKPLSLQHIDLQTSKRRHFEEQASEAVCQRLDASCQTLSLVPTCTLAAKTNHTAAVDLGVDVERAAAYIVHDCNGDEHDNGLPADITQDTKRETFRSATWQELHMVRSSKTADFNNSHPQRNGDTRPKCKSEPCQAERSSSHLIEGIAREQFNLAQTSRPSEVPRKGFLSKVVHSQQFDMISACGILANTVYVGIQTDQMIKSELLRIHGGITDQDWHFWGDFVFCVWFFIELILRISADKGNWFARVDRYWNFFDLAIVITSVIELVLDIFQIPLDVGMSVLRSLRLIRIVRMLRVANNFATVRNLKTMIGAMTNSISSFIPVAIMLGSLVYFFALLFMQGVKGNLAKVQPHQKNLEDVKLIRQYYGSLYTTLWTLFAAISGGADWGDVAAPIVKIGPLYALLFMSYILFVLFGLLNLLTGIFVDAATQSSRLTRQMVVDDAKQQAEDNIKQLVTLFMEADEDRNCTISQKEFGQYIQNPDIQAYFLALDLDVDRVDRMFTLLDPENKGALDVREFCEGIIHLRGNAKAVDVAMIMNALHKIEAKVEALDKQIPTAYA